MNQLTTEIEPLSGENTKMAKARIMYNDPSHNNRDYRYVRVLIAHPLRTHMESSSQNKLELELTTYLFDISERCAYNTFI